MDEEQGLPDAPEAAADMPQAPAGVTPPARRGGLAWLREGARVLAFRPPRWDGLQARPLTLAVLVLASYPIALVMQRALMDGEPRFLWNGILAGWVGTAAWAWLCWVVVRSRTAAVGPATLLAVSAAAGLVLNAIGGVAVLALRAAWGPGDDWPAALSWAVWLTPLSWAALMQAVLLWREAGTRAARAVLLMVLPIPWLVGGWLAPVSFWWSEPPADAEASFAGLPLTDEIVAAQSELLDEALAQLPAPQPGRINVYGLTYAPYASEDVFMRESATVAKTMRERFGAGMVELVVNPATAASLPWATPLNLRHSIARIAARMDRERDVLILHLTSHGGADGRLATETWPLQTEPMTPQLLKRWLDEAGVRWRVVSVSACYSGSWVEPLAGDGTLVMTAADADHTSYGCGRKSELTFFGRAMYAEELRRTLSFTDAHAAARNAIEVREQEAGKSDGYSNPQLRMGEAIRPVLQRLERELGG
ncbi:C13 family peptidase [Roseateles asaccharophilus]|uniref:Peptidase C13 family protein n=1 Tax=Roseateles asaccharophilus TaxID=582607 RepID=A0ABU2AE17_9BURK|nr:C13 family peptidase [Roseateles asaccharophilus]MDR7335451.1 hypothetical protein [Roseateles asaccharophilus]